MKRTFATVFDQNYLVKGLVMLESLIRESFSKHTVHVLAMDHVTESALKAFNLRGVIVHNMTEFESATGMDEVRKTRSWQEYCWTCGSVFADYVCKDAITYIDADLFWFFDPEIIFHEIEDRAIGITPHRFAKKDERRLLPNGKFNVQFCAFQHEVGRAALKKWAKQCKEWCYNAHVDGKFGDQKYLDSWPSDYPGEVCEISNPGVGLAPWNIANFKVDVSGDHVMVDTYRLVMYHLHEFSEQQDGLFRYTGWPLRESDRQFIYGPYVKAYREWKRRLEQVAA